MPDINQFTITDAVKKSFTDRGGTGSVPPRQADRAPPRLHARDQPDPRGMDAALNFLYDCGQISTPERHEFILLVGRARLVGAGRHDQHQGRRDRGLATSGRSTWRTRRRRRSATISPEDREGVTVLVHGTVQRHARHNRCRARCSTPGRPTAPAPIRSRRGGPGQVRSARRLHHRRRGPLLVHDRPAEALHRALRRPGRRAAARRQPPRLAGGAPALHHPRRGHARDHHRGLLREHRIHRQRCGLRRAEIAGGQGRAGPQGRKISASRTAKKPDAVLTLRLRTRAGRLRPPAGPERPRGEPPARVRRGAGQGAVDPRELRRRPRRDDAERVARRVSLTPAAARRSLITLRRSAMSGRRASGSSCAPRCSSLGSAFYFSARIGEVLQPELQRLVEQFGDASSIATLDGTDVIYIAHYSCSAPAGRPPSSARAIRRTPLRSAGCFWPG